MSPADAFVSGSRTITPPSKPAPADQAGWNAQKNSSMPIYEPDRERIVFDNIARYNPGPLSDIQLRQVYERLIDVMRQIQGDEMTPTEAVGGTELEPKD